MCKKNTLETYQRVKRRPRSWVSTLLIIVTTGIDSKHWEKVNDKVGAPTNHCNDLGGHNLADVQSVADDKPIRNS